MTTQRTLDRAAYIIFIALILLAPLVLQEFWLNRIAKFLVFGILGVAVSLCWGYGGILNLGQGLFFGAGAYMLAMSLKLASNTSLQQGSDQPVPDFMLWNAEPGAPTELCCISNASFLWLPFQSQWFGVAMGVLVPVVLAAILGVIVFRKRIAGVFVSVITLALALLVRLLIIDAQPVTNGFNGLTDLGTFTVAGFEFDPYSRATYYLVAGFLALALIGSRLLVETRAGVGRKFQIPSVFRDFTVRGNLDVASCADPRVRANLGIGIPRARRRRIDEVLELTGLTDVASTQAANLSHGQTQWLELGMLIVQDPKVLLLDEPTAGMTQAETHKTAEIVKGLRGQHTILVVEHDMAFVREIAETITVMHLGKVLAEGSIKEIENNPDVRRAYLGSHGIAMETA